MDQKNPEILSSSLKNSKFEGMSSEKIIEKYEIVLASREKQITDLCIEIGSLNEKVSTLADQLKKVNAEKEEIKYKMDKRVL